MNFKLENIREDNDQNKNNFDSNKIKPKSNAPPSKIAIIFIVAIFVCAIGIFGYLFILDSESDTSESNKDQSSNNSNIDNSSPNENSIPIDHSSNLTLTQYQINDMNDSKFEYEVLLLDTVCKVEKSILYYGCMDNTAPDASESLKEYINRVYNIPEDQKTDCEKFYCALWNGRNKLLDFCFEYLKKNKINGAEKFKNSNEYLNNYIKEYFQNAKFNNTSVNKYLKEECEEFLLSIKQDSRGFYNLSEYDSFIEHFEDYSKYLPKEAENYTVYDDGSASFTIKKTSKTEKDNNGNPKVYITKFYFHQTGFGEIYYDTSEKVSDDQVEIGYMNRWDNSNFYYYKDEVSWDYIEKDTIEKLVKKGYKWVESNILEKKEGDKTHQIVFIN